MTTANLIDGKAIADEIHTQTAIEIQRLKTQHGVTPGLAVILVGENPASVAYVGMKDKMATKLGLYSEKITLPQATTESELLQRIAALNAHPKIHGILVQSPTPPHINEDKVFNAIDPAKDVDGFHPVNVGKLALGDPTTLAPCTPSGVHHLLIRSGVKIAGKHVVILGRSRIVGKPLALILMQKAKNADATVTICHSRSENLAEHSRRADIVIAAIGVAQFLKADMICDGAVVIDVGVNRIEDKSAGKGYRLVGDVDFEACRKKASLITPVPGGVGPMTIAMLMSNTVKACRQLHRIA